MADDPIDLQVKENAGLEHEPARGHVDDKQDGHDFIPEPSAVPDLCTGPGYAHIWKGIGREKEQEENYIRQKVL